VVRTGAQVIGGISNWSTSVYGVSTDYLSIREWPLSSGEFFTEGDVRSQTKVCILGQTLVKNLFPDNDPVGQQVRIRNVPFKVIGVLSEKGQNSMGMDQDDIVLAPSSTVFYRLSGFRFISQILTSAASTAEIPAAQEEIRTILRESHKINEGEDDDFTVRNQTELASTAEETTRVMTILLASIASISLLVGGIGIMNIMLVSVTERTREIGVRMALGARSRDILVQFLVEAVVISIVGGLIGIVLGVGATLVVGAVTSWTTVIVPSTLFVSVGFSAMVGIFFGLYPAKKASDLNPIEALRYE
jgi:putative ABC transport system permease protein